MSTATTHPRLAAFLTAVVGALLVVAGCASEVEPGQEPTGIGVVSKRRPGAGDREAIPWDGTEAGDADTKPAAAPCRGGSLDLKASWDQPEGDATVGVLTVTNRGDAACLLPITPPARLVDGAGQTLATDRPPPPKTAVAGATELVLEPSGSARAELWWSSWCGPEPDRVAVELLPAGDAAPIGSAPARMTPPPCTEGAPSVLEAKQFQLADAGDGVLYANPTALEIELDLPKSAKSGQTLNYRVVLSNPGRWTVRLDPCPNFRDELQLPSGTPGGREQGWTSTSESWFRLNCDSLGGNLAPGDSAVFEMVTHIPPGTPGGFALLRWTLEASKKTIREEAQLLIEEGD